MITLKPYSAYKDSGIEWLGELPDHWSKHRLGKILTRNDSGAWGDDGSEDDVPVLRSTEQTVNGTWRIVSPAFRSLNARDFARTRLIEGDLVVTTSSGSPAHIGKTSVVTSAMEGRGYSFSNFMQRLRPNHRLLSQLLWYLLNNPIARDQLVYLSSTTTGLANLSGRILGAVSIPLPPLDEQRAIADFLDSMDARITRFIDARRKMIALLEEKKQALINQAVTRGLDPDVPLKGSGVDWLGEIPEHWEVRTLKHLTSHIVDCLHATPVYELDGDFPAIRTSDIIPGKVLYKRARRIASTEYERWTARLRPRKGDILYSREGDYGIAAPVPANVELCISQRMMVFRSMRWMNSQFLMWQLNSSHTLAQASIDADGSTVPHVNISTIRNYQLAVPPMEEQQDIADHIDHETSRIDKLIDRHRSEIELMQEYRTRLISDVVTGKLDVRGVQLPQVEAVIGEEIEAAIEEERIDTQEALEP